MYFIEILHVVNPTSAVNAQILAQIPLWTDGTMNTVYETIGGVQTVVQQRDNGNLNYEWYLTYNTGGLIDGGMLLHRYKASADIMRHVVPGIPWSAGIWTPASSRTSGIGPKGQKWYNLLPAMRAQVAQMVGPLADIYGTRIPAWSYFGQSTSCNVKGRTYGSDVVTVLYFFNVTNPSAITAGVWNINMPEKMANVKATEPGTIGFEVLMENGPSGFHESGMIITTFTSATAAIAHIGLVDHSWPMLQTATSIEYYNIPTANYASVNTTQYGPQIAVTNYGPRHNGYPVCGY